MSEMIERAARAIEKHQLDDGGPCCLYSADLRLEIARTVIAALREPTDEELSMAVKEAVQAHGLYPDQQYYLTVGIVRIAYQSVIDKALGD